MSVSDETKTRVWADARSRCGYCLSPQDLVMGVLEIDHIIPRGRGGTDDEENLWLACRLCNHFKNTQPHGRDPMTGRRVRLFNPRKQSWWRHFRWSTDGTRVIGRTVCGRATVVALKLNNLIAEMVRARWCTAGWHPPRD